VHAYKPEDFLVVFTDGRHMDTVAALPSLLIGGCPLFFRRWNRLANAQRVVAGSHVHLVIEGISPHAWDCSTVEHLLGTSCALEEIAPESASRADLGFFKVTAWAREEKDIPPCRMLWVPELEGGVMAGGPQPVRRLHDLGLLEYWVLIHITRVDEYIAMEGPVWTSSPQSVQSGLPSRGSTAEGGFWTSRNVRWTEGRPDVRGGQSGGHGGGGGAQGGVNYRSASSPSGPSD
jgi:hypothetical protein